MPKTNNVRREVQRISFSFLKADTVTLSSGSSTSTFALDPTISGKIGNIADEYALYRFVEVGATLYNPGPAGASAAESVACVLSYSNGITDTAPATAAAAANMEKSVLTGFHNQVGSESAPTQYCSVPQKLKLSRAELVTANSQIWWKTKASTNVEAWQETQGQFFLTFDSSASSSSVVGYGIMFKGWIEFSNPVNVAQTPAESERSRREMFARQPGSGAILDSTALMKAVLGTR